MTATTNADTFDRILVTPIPSARGQLRRVDRVVQARTVRDLFRSLGVKGCSVTAPRYSMATGIDVRIPKAEDHDRGWESGHDFATCPLCDKRTRAMKHVRAIILGAFPDMDDRSDTLADYYDDPIHIK